MTLGPLLLLWIVLAPVALGVLALRALGLRPADDRLGFAAWTWPCGALALGLALFVYLWFGVEPWLWVTAPVLAALPLLLAIARRPSAAAAPGGPITEGPIAGDPVTERPVPAGDRDGAAPAAAARVGDAAPRRSRWFAAFVAAGALFCVVNSLAYATRPSVEGDEGNIWSLKAKSLIVDYYGGDFAAAQVWNLHPDYPLLNPLLQAWVYSQAGELVQFENRVPVQLCALALWLSLCAALRRRAPAWLAALLAATVLLAPQFYWMCRPAYADGMVALGLVLAVDGWLRHRDDRRPAWLWLVAVGAAFALWSKNEAALYAAAAAGAAVLALALRRGRLSPPRAATVGAVLLPLTVVTAQVLWNRRFALANDLFGENPLGKSLPQLIVEQFGERAGAVLAAAWRLVADPTREHGVLLVACAAPLLAPGSALGRRLFVPTLALVGSFVGLHVVYVGSHLELQQHLVTSQARVVFQLVPAATIWFAALVAELLGPGLERPAAAGDDLAAT